MVSMRKPRQLRNHARLHLPVPSPAAGILGAGKRGVPLLVPGAAEGSGKHRAILQRVGLGERLFTGRMNCQAANVSARPWRARS
jgi:hypothetical protein